MKSEAFEVFSKTIADLSAKDVDMLLRQAICAALAAAFCLSIVANSYGDSPSRHDRSDGETHGELSAGVRGEKVFDLPLSDGDSQRVLYVSPARPIATIVMLAGGAGDVGIERDGDIRHDDNFVVRTRALWVARGFAVLIPDTVNRANLRGVRSSPGYAHLIGDLAGFAHRQAPGPLFLLGTSQGSIAAMNGAAHAPPGTIAGLVLTESVSRMGGSHETVFSADPQDVTVPALVVANRDDACDVAPPQDALRIAASMIHSQSVRVIQVAGGTAHSSNVCGSLTPHGYYGIEVSVIDRISAWMREHI